MFSKLIVASCLIAFAAGAAHNAQPASGSSGSGSSGSNAPAPKWNNDNKFSAEALAQFPITCPVYTTYEALVVAADACVADYTTDIVVAMNAADPAGRRQARAGHVGGCVNSGFIAACSSRRARRAGHAGTAVCVAVADAGCDAPPTAPAPGSGSSGSSGSAPPAPTGDVTKQTMTLTIPGDFASLSAADKAATALSVETNIIATTELVAADIERVDLSSGSIVATVVFAGAVDAAKADAATAKVNQAITSGSFKVTVKGVEVTVAEQASSDSITEAAVTTAPTSAPTSAPAPPASSGSATAAAVAVVAASVLAAAL